MARIHFPAFRNATKLNSSSSNFRGRRLGPICQVFSWTDVPKNEAAAKNFVWNKSSYHSQEKWKNLLGGGGGRCHPTPIGGLNLWHVTGYRKYSVKFIGLCS